MAPLSMIPFTLSISASVEEKLGSFPFLFGIGLIVVPVLYLLKGGRSLAQRARAKSLFAFVSGFELDEEVKYLKNRRMEMDHLVFYS